jgi:hypothetical protein
MLVCKNTAVGSRPRGPKLRICGFQRISWPIAGGDRDLRPRSRSTPPPPSEHTAYPTAATKTHTPHHAPRSTHGCAMGRVVGDDSELVVRSLALAGDGVRAHVERQFRRGQHVRQAVVDLPRVPMREHVGQGRELRQGGGAVPDRIGSHRQARTHSTGPSQRKRCANRCGHHESMEDGRSMADSMRVGSMPLAWSVAGAQIS